MISGAISRHKKDLSEKLKELNSEKSELGIKLREKLANKKVAQLKLKLSQAYQNGKIQ